MSSAAGRTRVLSLYRDILRAANHLPTANRQGYVRAKARDGFKDNKHLTDAARIAFLIDYGECSLENIRSQAGHLGKLFQDPRMHGLY